MSLASRWSERRARWRQRTRSWRRVLERRAALDRWYPHVLIAVAMAPFGLLLVAAFVQTELGVGPTSLEVADLERRVSEVQLGPIVELAIGFSLIAMSVGVALRSRLAWLWSVSAMSVGLALRLPPESVDVPFALFFAGILALLLLHRRSFASRSVVTSAVFAIVMLATLFIWATLGTLRLGDQFEPPVHDLVTALYVTVVTVSSVGFGDIVARGPEARLFVVAMIMLGIGVLATALSAILLPLIGGRLREVMGGRAQVDRTNHYVIVGNSPLARIAALELEKRGQRVTLVLEKTPEDDFYHQRDVVVGDPADLSVLRTAGAEAAKGVLCLSTDDATNGFVVLGVNEFEGTIPTVAALNDPKYRLRLKRTQPSMLLSLQALGGELLAMALTGEHVDIGMLKRVLEIHGAEPETKEGL
jgi:voltage-gated potassium channel